MEPRSFVLTPWLNPQPWPALAAETLHLWRFPLLAADSLPELLDELELQRAERLRSTQKRREFTVARTRMRQILAGYLDVAPRELNFAYGPDGKPFLAGQQSRPLAFNLAHRGDWGLCAVTTGVEVGVDIERVDEGLDIEGVATGYFSASERQELLVSPAARRRRLFYRLWTRKEAWLKGQGSGFSTAAQDPGAAHLAGCCTHDGTWWLRSLPVSRRYLAAVAARQSFRLIERWNGWPAD